MTTGLEGWVLNPNCRVAESLTDERLRREITRLTNEVSYWKERAVLAESVIAKRDASIFTATGIRRKRGVQFGGLTE